MKGTDLCRGKVTDIKTITLTINPWLHLKQKVLIGLEVKQFLLTDLF